MAEPAKENKKRMQPSDLAVYRTEGPMQKDKKPVASAKKKRRVWLLSDHAGYLRTGCNKNMPGHSVALACIVFLGALLRATTTRRRYGIKGSCA